MNFTCIFMASFLAPFIALAGSNQKVDDLRFIQAQIRACPEAREFLEKKVKPLYNGRVKIIFRDQEDLGWPAQCSTAHGTIEIAHELDKFEKLQATMFELANLSQREDLNFYHDNMCLMDRYSYGSAVEKLEYQSSKTSDRIVKACQQRNIWSSRVKTYDFKNLNQCLCTQEKAHTPRYWDKHQERCGKSNIKKPKICDRAQYARDGQLDPFGFGSLFSDLNFPSTSKEPDTAFDWTKETTRLRKKLGLD